jgi:hypothetical protein
MDGDRTTYECVRCKTAFPVTADHTEIVRRDFVELSRPTRIERLCSDCWEAYVTDFLGGDFEETMAKYESG